MNSDDITHLYLRRKDVRYEHNKIALFKLYSMLRIHDEYKYSYIILLDNFMTLITSTEQIQV